MTYEFSVLRDRLMVYMKEKEKMAAALATILKIEGTENTESL